MGVWLSVVAMYLNYIGENLASVYARYERWGESYWVMHVSLFSLGLMCAAWENGGGSYALYGESRAPRALLSPGCHGSAVISPRESWKGGDVGGYVACCSMP